jgi:DNA invertase Pin-like site-specific DNA recombinase
LIGPERDIVRDMSALSESEVAEIAAKVGPPRSTNNGKIALDVDRVRAMLGAGFSWRQIAAYFGVGVSTVRRRLDEAEGRRTATRSDQLGDLPAWWPWPKEPQ